MKVETRMLFAIVILLICLNYAVLDHVILKIPNGILLGRETWTTTNKLYYSFQKIPYAIPPVGSLRFQSPQPVENWDGILDATKIDVMCYQLNDTNHMESEDCLYLNVYTTQLPSRNDSKPLPVIIWIHGGRWSNGNSLEDTFGPQYLLDENVIIVTINYRLGVFGFLSTMDDVIPGNYGLKDQSLAIQWVYKNIEYFGGDCGKIIIAGQSAGAGAVSFQLLNSKVDGMIKGAICESGVAINIWNNKTAAREIAFTIGSYLNEIFINSNDSVALHEYLLEAPAKDLERAVKQVASKGIDNLWRLFGPVIEVEHSHAFITMKMYEKFRDGNFIRVPIILGFNSEEHIRNALSNRNQYRRFLQKLDDTLELITPPDMRIESIVNRKKMGGAIRRIYTNHTFAKDLAPGVKFMTDNDFVRGIIRKAELVSRYTNVYFYRFNYDGKLGNVNGEIEGAERVAHAEELNYIWYRTTFVDNRNLTTFPKTDILTHKRLIKMWTNFAKTLNPTPEPLELLQNITWKIANISENGDLIYLDICENLELKTNPRSETYRQWKAIYSSLGFDDFDTF